MKHIDLLFCRVAFEKYCLRADMASTSPEIAGLKG